MLSLSEMRIHSMKRIFKGYCHFAWFSACFLLCFAANSTYELDELGMSIELPSDHVVFTGTSSK